MEDRAPNARGGGAEVEEGERGWLLRPSRRRVEGWLEAWWRRWAVLVGIPCLFVRLPLSFFRRSVELADNWSGGHRSGSGAQSPSPSAIPMTGKIRGGSCRRFPGLRCRPLRRAGEDITPLLLFPPLPPRSQQLPPAVIPSPLSSVIQPRRPHSRSPLIRHSRRQKSPISPLHAITAPALSGCG